MNLSIRNVFCRKSFFFVSFLAMTSVMVSACADAPEILVSEDSVGSVTAQDSVADETAKDLSKAIGQTVVVRGEIAEVLGEVSFVLEDGGLFEDERVLVIDVTDHPLALSEDDEPDVLVVGEVQTLTITDIEATYGIALDPAIYADYDTRPVIFARTVELSPEPAEISGNPHLYYNQRIALTGDIEEILSADAFIVDEDGLFYGEDLLVVVPEASSQLSQEIRKDEPVAFTGILRPYIQKEFDTYYGFDWDLELEKRINVDFIEKPVFVADEVYSSSL